MSRTRLFSAVVGAALLVMPAKAHAATFTLDDVHVIVQGGFADFKATLTRVSGDPNPLFLNSLSVSLPGLAVDDSPFDFWPPSLSGGTSFTGTLFTVAANLSVAPGTYAGSVSILGGAEGPTLSNPTGSQDEVAFQDFSVVVQPVPEPGTLALLGLGLAGLSLRRRRSR